MIITVPHSGTRTLCKHLGETQFYHFGQNEAFFQRRKDPIDFAVRDPLNHYVSWICFEGSGNNFQGFFNRYEMALDWLLNYEHGVNYHVMENLPILDGRGPNRDHPLRKMVAEKDFMGLRRDIPELFIWLEQERIDNFFNQFYPDRWYRDEKDIQLSATG